jgi:hypothetical protein
MGFIPGRSRVRFGGAGPFEEHVTSCRLQQILACAGDERCILISVASAADVDAESVAQFGALEPD